MTAKHEKLDEYGFEIWEENWPYFVRPSATLRLRNFATS